MELPEFPYFGVIQNLSASMREHVSHRLPQLLICVNVQVSHTKSVSPQLPVTWSNNRCSATQFAQSAYLVYENWKLSIVTVGVELNRIIISPILSLNGKP